MIENSNKNIFRDNLKSGKFSIVIRSDISSGTSSNSNIINELESMFKNSDMKNIVISATTIPAQENFNALLNSANQHKILNDKSVIVEIQNLINNKESFIEDLKQLEKLQIEDIQFTNCDISCIKQKLDSEDELLETADMIKLAKTQNNSFNIGTSISPFRYNADELLMQYYKTIYEIDNGVDFVVTDAGWDMKKLQELQWFISMHEYYTPLLATIHLPDENEVQTMHVNQKVSSITSESFISQLQSEANLGEHQALSIQLRRIPLMVAGCKLLGYSGVILTGIKNGQLLRILMKRISESLIAFNSWKSWLEQWQNFHEGIDFTPVSNRFYLFEELFSPDSDTAIYGKQPMKDVEKIKPSLSDRVRFRLGKTLKLDKDGNAIHSFVKYLAYQSNETSPLLAYQPLQCPLKLKKGSCGTAKDGFCQFTKSQKCTFNKSFQILNWFNQLDTLK